MWNQFGVSQEMADPLADTFLGTVVVVAGLCTNRLDAWVPCAALQLTVPFLNPVCARWPAASVCAARCLDALYRSIAVDVDGGLVCFLIL